MEELGNPDGYCDSETVSFWRQYEEAMKDPWGTLHDNRAGQLWPGDVD